MKLTKRSRSFLAGGLIAAGSLAGVGGSASAASLPSSLGPGQVLLPGTRLASPSGTYRLAMQPDGNLVERRGASVVWQTRTNRHGGSRLVMQKNGDLVIYSSANHPLWSSATPGHPGASLVVGNDGDVVVYAPTHRALWRSERPLPPLHLGSRGKAVAELQRRLTALHYWTGRPNGYFGDATEQAMFALDKVAGIARTGVLDKAASAALTRGVEPKPRRASGNLVEVNLAKDLVMIIRHGKLAWTINTSTGGGYTYTSGGVTSVAVTPKGVFHIYREIDGIDVAPLGTLWRPKFFTGGYAIHGDSYVPAYPVSHGCVRVSDEAINWIWANNLVPMGSEVWVF
jgi:N-acetylmuramoyl-L-alanine amidase